MRLGVEGLPCRPLLAPPRVEEGRLGSVKEKPDLRESLDESLESEWVLIESLTMLGSSGVGLGRRVFAERKLKLPISMSWPSSVPTSILT